MSRWIFQHFNLKVNLPRLACVKHLSYKLLAKTEQVCFLCLETSAYYNFFYCCSFTVHSWPLWDDFLPTPLINHYSPLSKESSLQSSSSLLLDWLLLRRFLLEIVFLFHVLMGGLLSEQEQTSLNCTDEEIYCRLAKTIVPPRTWHREEWWLRVLDCLHCWRYKSQHTHWMLSAYQS